MKKKFITIFSTSRSDFYILSSLIDEIKIHKKIDYNLVLGGDHLVFKNKINLIKKKFKISAFLDFYKNDNYNYKNFCYSMSKINLRLEKIYNSLKSNFILVLGDRSELLPIIHHALINKKKIIHIGGGENTFGALDNDIRNMISEASSIHFTMHRNYKLNLINKVKQKNKIFNVGYLGLDRMSEIKKLNNKNLIFKKFNLREDNLILFTFHASLEDIKKNIKELKKILLFLIKKKYVIVATFPGMELENYLIKSLLLDLKKNKNFKLYKNLGEDYLSLMKFSKFIIGNSSSGLIEAPYFKIPAINIGDRQNGRIKHKNILNRNSFLSKIKKMKYMFGDKNIARKIIGHIIDEK